MGAQVYFALYNVTLNSSQLQLIEDVIETEPDIHTVLYVIDQKTGICNGDSGGPIFRMKEGVAEIVGVTSFRLDECGNGWPGGFTSVGHFYDWIMKTIEFEVNGDTWAPTADPTSAMPTASPTTSTTLFQLRLKTFQMHIKL